MACHRYALNAIPVEISLVLSTIWRKCYICSGQLLIIHSSVHRFGTLLQFCAVGPDITVCVVWSPVDTAWPLIGLPPTDKHSNVYHCLLLMCIGIYLCTVNRLMDKTCCVMFRIFVNFSVSQLRRLLPSTSCLKIQSSFFSLLWAEVVMVNWRPGNFVWQ